MRKIKGFICIAVFHRENMNIGELFGKNMDGGKIGNFENFQTNNLTPFAFLREARVAKKEIQIIPYIRNVSIAYLEMNLAETMEEIYSLRNKKRLEVIISLVLSLMKG